MERILPSIAPFSLLTFLVITALTTVGEITPALIPVMLTGMVIVIGRKCGGTWSVVTAP